MLERMQLAGVGPAPKLEMELAPRLNVITGDNGLGKSFLLETAWWILSRTWADGPAVPSRSSRARKPAIGFSVRSKSKTVDYVSHFDHSSQTWAGKVGRPINPGLVLFAQASGGFSVWDPARNYWKGEKSHDGPERPTAFLFQPSDVWNGLRSGSEPLCNGLISDWAGWQKEKGETFETLKKVLDALSPDPLEPIRPGKLTRITLNDSRDMPTLTMPYGEDVPVVHCSAGMKRILALAYLLVWAWQEHVHASELRHEKTSRQIIFLIDEIEAHLHPKWQRKIFRSLFEVMNALIGKTQIQMLVATHSPLILASLEPLFDEDQDKLFDLDLVSRGDKRTVELREVPWRKMGEASDWLTSDVFQVSSGRAEESEQLLEEASKMISAGHVDPVAARGMHERLRAMLGDSDPFWIRWRFLGEKQGWLK